MIRARTTAPTDSRAGFTIVELTVTLVLVALIGAALWGLAQVGTSVHQRELRRADSERTRHNVEASAGRALELAARAGFSAPNLGMLRVGVAATASGAPADTLVLLRAVGPALTVASRACRSAVAAGESCVPVQGDRLDRIHPGDVIAVGSSRTGYRLLQVAAVDGPYTASCGADCPAASFCPVSVSPGVSVSEVLLGTSGPAPATAPSCAESYYPDGSMCVETRVARTTTPRTRSVCSATGATSLYTDLRAVDRTAAIGFPAPREWAGLSAGGAPALAAVPVEPVRIFPTEEAPDFALVLQRGLTASGAWNPSRRVAGPIASFRVETQHQGNAAWYRGDDVDAAGLAASPNRSATAVPAAGEVGINYLRGYHTLVGARVDAGAVGLDRAGNRISVPVRILQSLAPLARGGARAEP